MYERQHDLINAATLAHKNILVVGVGAIGRQVAIGLAAMGANNITICDMDTIDESNVATQGYSMSTVGTLKVNSLRYNLIDVNNNINLYRDTEAWNPKTYKEKKFDIVFSCVDRMDVRRSIYLYAKKTGVDLFLDGRMLAEMCHVFLYTKDNIDEYEKTLFTDQEALPGRCTARGTLYMAGIASNLMLGKLAMALRGIKMKPQYTFNLVGELI